MNAEFHEPSPGCKARCIGEGPAPRSCAALNLWVGGCTKTNSRLSFHRRVPRGRFALPLEAEESRFEAVFVGLVFPALLGEPVVEAGGGVVSGFMAMEGEGGGYGDGGVTLTELGDGRIGEDTFERIGALDTPGRLGQPEDEAFFDGGGGAPDAELALEKLPESFGAFMLVEEAGMQPGGSQPRA